MKRFISFLLFTLTVVCVSAQKVSFAFNDDSEPVQIQKIGGGSSYLSFSRLYEKDGGVVVQMDVQNIMNDQLLIIFKYQHFEKELKKSNPSIRFGKQFPGRKGSRYVSPYKESDKDYIIIGSEEQKKIQQFIMKDGSKENGTLPFYIAKYKNKRKSKIEILGVEEVNYELLYEEKEDPDYQRLLSSYKQMKNELASATLIDCKVKPTRKRQKHHPDLDQQRNHYRQKLDNLKKEVEGVISSHNWSKSSKNHKLYSKLQTDLNALRTDNLTVVDCDKCGKNISSTPVTGGWGNPPISKPIQPSISCSCGLCNTSLATIHKQMQTYYMQIDNGKVSKARVMSKVQALYNSCASCKLRKESFSGKIKNSIDRTYNSIINHK